MNKTIEKLKEYIESWTDDYDEIQDGIIAWMPLPNRYINEE